MTIRPSLRTGALSILLITAPVVGQAIDSAKFTAVERAQLDHTAKLRRNAAIEVLLADLRKRTTSTEAGPRSAAFAEYEVLRVAVLANGLVHPARTLAAFTKLTETPLAKAYPALRDTLLTRIMVLHHVLGQTAQCAEVRRELGFLDDWWMIGPFDNERGSGYGQDFGPERELELDRTYQGKKREVRWRRLPIRSASGFIDLGSMLRPYRQVLCHVATSLVSEREVDAVLRLGSSEGFEVFLNGAKVGGRDLQRRFGYDQDAVVLPLRTGPNLLLLRILTQKGGLSFAARLRQLSGSPLLGVAVRSGRDDLVAAGSQQPRARQAANKDTVPNVGARSVFGDGPADAYRLGSVLSFFHADDYTDHRLQNIVRRAVRGLPNHPAPRYALATTRIQANRVIADREDNPRRHDYQAILRSHPDFLAARLALAQMDLQSTNAAAQAERRIREAMQLNPTSRTLHLARWSVLNATNLPGLARLALEQAASSDADGNVLVEARRRLGMSYRGEGRLDEASACFRDLIGLRRVAADRLDLAQILARTGKRDAVIKLLEEGAAAFPLDMRFRFRHSRLLEAEGNIDAAMKPLQEWLTVCPEDDSALIELARLYGLNGQVDRQRELLRSAVTLNPNRKKDRRRLEFLEAEARPFYADFEVSGAAMIAKDRGAPPDAKKANDPYYYLMDQQVVHAYRNGTTSTYRHFIARVLNSEGSKAFARYVIPHYRREQRARLLEVKIHKVDGTVQRPRLRGTSALLPGLSRGDVVEIRQRVDDNAPGFFGDYFGFAHHFGGMRPTNVASLTVVLDQGRQYQLQTANGAPRPTRTRDAAGNQVWRFEMRDLARRNSEGRQPHPSETQPLVRITTYASWNAFASWWWNLIKKQSEVSPEIRSKVEALTVHLDNTSDKIEAIYKFVTTDVRYEAWEFGVHGYKPYSTPVIFERRHGDCKDKSLLLNSMLSVIGVTAYPVLIRADRYRSRDDLSLPMVNHFNHCISYVPKTADTPAMFLDGTATYHPLDTLPEMDRGAAVLVVRGPKGRIQTIPWPDALANHDRVHLDIELSKNGDAAVHYRFEPTAIRAVWVRSYLGNEPGKRREHLEKLLKDDFGAITIQNEDVGDLLDFHSPVSVKVRFKARRLAVAQGEGLVLKAAIGTDSLAQLALAETRTMPLILGVPESSQHTIRYTLPTGYAPLTIPEPTALQAGFGSFSLTWKKGDGTLEVVRRLAITTNRIPPEDYQAFREFATKVDDASQQVVVIEKERGSR